MVDAVFERAAVLPAPVGVVFRAPDVLKRWMELHYVSLSDALEFVDDRAVARVHVVRADGKAENLEAGSDLARGGHRVVSRAAPSCRGGGPLRLEEITGLALSAAFLVERDLLEGFLARRRRAAGRASSPATSTSPALGAVRFRPHAVRRLTGVLSRVRHLESRVVGGVQRCDDALPELERGPFERPDEEITRLRRATGNRYRVLHRLGGGGMADVYVAEQVQLARRVVIKVLHPHLARDAEVAERFRREAEAAAKLVHPHICAHSRLRRDAGRRVHGHAVSRGRLARRPDSEDALRRRRRGRRRWRRRSRARSTTRIGTASCIAT